MNIERMEALAALIETVPEKKFDMRNWITYINHNEAENEDDGAMPALTLLGECGTAACVAGWTIIQAYPDKKQRLAALGDIRDIESMASRYLGLTHRQADWLFMGRWGRSVPDSSIGRGTNKEAAQAIRALMVAKDSIPRFKLT